MRKTLRVLVAFASLILLLALIVGLPTALIVTVGNPIGTAEVSGARDLFAGRNLAPTELIGSALAIALWVLWVQIIWTTAAELVAVVRGDRRHLRRRSLSGLRPAIGKLVGTAALLLGFLSRPVGADIALGIPTTTELTDTTPDLALTSADSTTTRPYVTKAGDTWWDLADQHMNDGKRWKELRELNLGTRVSRSDTITRDTNRLGIGWTLTIPNDAAANTTASEVQTVADGDSLWTIAKATLPPMATDNQIDAQVLAITAANTDTLEDPDLIRPGQQLIVPTVEPVPAVESNADLGVIAEEPVSAVLAGESNVEPVPAVESNADLGVIAEEPVSAVLAGESNVEPVPAVPADESESSLNERYLVVAATLLVVSYLTLALRNRRAAALRKRRKGTRPRPVLAQMETVTRRDPTPRAIDTDGISSDGPDHPNPLVETTRQEQAHIYDWDGGSEDLDVETESCPHADFVAAALQVMSEALALCEPDLLPNVMGVWSTPDRLAVEFTSGSAWIEPMIPFRSYGENKGWMIDRESLPALDTTTSGANGPLPGLVTLGATSTFEIGEKTKSRTAIDAFGTTFVTFALNVEELRTIHLAGLRPATTDFLRVAATELALSRTADWIDVACIGFGEDLEGMERLRNYDSLEDVRPMIDALATTPVTRPFVARVADQGADSYYPFVVLHDLTSAEETVTGCRGVTLITTTKHDEANLTLELDDGFVSSPDVAGGAKLKRPQLDTDQVATLFTDKAHEEIGLDPDFWDQTLSGLLSDAVNGSTGHEHAEGHEDVERPVDTTNDPIEASEEAPHVSLLGPILINGVSPTDPNRPWKYTKVPELICYLLLVGRGQELHQEKLMTALFPDEPANKRRINLYVSNARTKALGTDPEGNLYLPRAANNRDPHYKILPTVTSDLAIFDDACRRASHAKNRDNALAKWTEALSLVRGRPFDVATYQGWAWATALCESAIIKVEEAALAMAEQALEADEPDQALWAAEKGLLTGTDNYDVLTMYGRAALAAENPTASVQAMHAIQAAANQFSETPEFQEAVVPEPLVDIYDALRQRKAS